MNNIEEEKAKIIFREKELVRISDVKGDEDGLAHPVTWSNLLDSALNGDQKRLDQLISIASLQEIKLNLENLKKAYRISCRFQDTVENIEEESVGHACVDCYYYYTTIEEVKPKQLIRAKVNFLLSLTKEIFCYIKLDNQDKRFIEHELLSRVKSADTIDDLIQLYEKYDQAGLLEHQRDPITYQIKSFLFRPNYSRLTSNFVVNLQEKALQVLGNSDLLKDNKDAIEKLGQTIFADKHIQYGISKNKKFILIQSQLHSETNFEMQIEKKSK